MDISSEQILAFIESHKSDLQKFGVHKLGLFGSYVRNEQTISSDIDLLVEYIPGEKSFDNFVSLIDYLEASFGKEVELVTSESLSPHIKPYIEREIQYAQF
jgi:uncharacterized protein